MQPVQCSARSGLQCQSTCNQFPSLASNISRHLNRVREIALQQMIEGTAQERIRRAVKTQARPSGELHDLHAGDQIGLFRAPADCPAFRHSYHTSPARASTCRDPPCPRRGKGRSPLPSPAAYPQALALPLRAISASSLGRHLSVQGAPMTGDS